MRRLLFLAIIIVVATSLFAQQSNRNQRLDDLRAKKIEFIKHRVNMTDEEEKAFWPLYNELEQKKWEIGMQREQLRNAKKDGNVDYAKLNDLLIYSEVARAKVVRSYHEQFKKILPPEKLFRYYLAEREFKEKMLNEIKRKAEGKRK